MTAPVNDTVSNWAYMVMASLAWTLKAWAALLLPEEPRRAEEHRAERRRWLRMEFATFRAAVIELPCQVVRGGGRLIYRLLSWNPWQGALLRLVERLRGAGCTEGRRRSRGPDAPTRAGRRARRGGRRCGRG